MKKTFILSLITLFSASLFAGSKCVNLTLKNNVESCYLQPSQSKAPHAVDSYIIEYECLEKKVFSKKGEQYDFSKLTTKKKSYINKRKCQSIAEHIAKYSEYPDVIDLIKYSFQ